MGLHDTPTLDSKEKRFTELGWQVGFLTLKTYFTIYSNLRLQSFLNPTLVVVLPHVDVAALISFSSMKYCESCRELLLWTWMQFIINRLILWIEEG